MFPLVTQRWLWVRTSVHEASDCVCVRFAVCLHQPSPRSHALLLSCVYVGCLCLRGCNVRAQMPAMRGATAALLASRRPSVPANVQLDSTVSWAPPCPTRATAPLGSGVVPGPHSAPNARLANTVGVLAHKIRPSVLGWGLLSHPPVPPSL